MLIIGVDPGLTGAIALFDTNKGSHGEIVHVWDMPTDKIEVSGKPRNAVSPSGVFDLFWESGASHAVIEKVGGLPGQSGSASFNFGYGAGLLHGAAIALGMEVERPAPLVWKAKMKAPRDKKLARGRATEMMPNARHWWPNAGHHDRAEAAMLALYGARHVWPMLAAQKSYAEIVRED